MAARPALRRHARRIVESLAGGYRRRALIGIFVPTPGRDRKVTVDVAAFGADVTRLVVVEFREQAWQSRHRNERKIRLGRILRRRRIELLEEDLLVAFLA